MQRKVTLKRWNNYLKPNLSKSKWTEENSKKLFELHTKYGSHWKEISQHFDGRTDNSVKNQFFALVRKSLRRISKFLQIPKSTSNKTCSILPKLNPKF